MTDRALTPSQQRVVPTALEAIRDWYHTPDEMRKPLTANQEAIRKRLLAAYGLLLDDARFDKCAQIHAKNFALSEAQAMRDLRDAANLFPEAGRVSKEARRAIVHHRLEVLWSIHDEKGDTEGMERVLKLMIKNWGTEKDDPDRPDFSKLQPSLFTIVLDDATRALVNQLLSKGSGGINLADVSEQLFPAEDIEHEEVRTDDPGTHPG